MTAKGLAENPLGINGKAPKAAKMLKMIYDCNLEKTAAEHTNKCEFKHSSGSGNGENLWGMWPAQENLTKAASYVSWDYNTNKSTGSCNVILLKASTSWFDELRAYGVPPDNMMTDELWYRPKMPIGHYTQVYIFVSKALFLILFRKLFEDGVGKYIQTWLWYCDMLGHDSCHLPILTSVRYNSFFQIIPQKNVQLKHCSGNYNKNMIYTIGEPCKADEDCKCDGCKCSPDEALCIKPS
ncbi:hypothetical protein KIN20_000273 [Parelaphostrongylus tenuis]|uniref:SCP domain-containing protein n=1 Tax=Parelaphostrongylus tenuis TaxID=148309 RepID=A0AAD5QDN9_PARTN|nr:hypothetical protein KIN20_000273 [Parelaphostrongylus tenuis]